MGSAEWASNMKTFFDVVICARGMDLNIVKALKYNPCLLATCDTSQADWAFILGKVFDFCNQHLNFFLEGEGADVL